MLTETSAAVQNHAPNSPAPYTSIGRARHPLLAFFFAAISAFIGMLYVGQAKRAFVFLALEAGCFLLAKITALFLLWPYAAVAAAGLFFVKTAGIVQTVKLAHRYRYDFNGPWYRYWYTAPLLTFCFIVAMFAAFTYVIDLKKINGNSMVPTLLDHEYIISYTWPFKPVEFFSQTLVHKAAPVIKRGDLMVFRYPDQPQEVLVKRIIGLPGDQIFINRNQLIINGKQVKRREYDKNEERITFEEDLDGARYRVVYSNVDFPHATQQFLVPENSYFVLGDNRDISYDSRYWLNSYVPLSHFLGKAVFIWWSETTPPAPIRWDRIGIKPR